MAALLKKRISFKYLGGLKYTLCRFAVYCRICQVTLESKHDRDFSTCECGSVSIDGGLLDGRIIGNTRDWESRNVYKAFFNGKTFWMPQF